MKLLGRISLALFALTATLSAFAVEKSLTIYNDSALNGQKISAGDYKVEYEINGSTAQVKLLKNKKTVVSATGQLVEEPVAADENAVVRSVNPDGSTRIVEIVFAKQKSAIRFAAESSDKGK